MSFFDDLTEFGQKLVEGVKYVTAWLVIAVESLTKFEKIIPAVVEFIYNLVGDYMPKVESGEVTGDQAQKDVEEATLATFHGSGPLVTRPVVRQIIEQAVIVHQAKSESQQNKDAGAMEKGYINRDEYERARKAWPGLQPLD